MKYETLVVRASNSPAKMIVWLVLVATKFTATVCQTPSRNSVGRIGLAGSLSKNAEALAGATSASEVHVRVNVDLDGMSARSPAL